jgi:hypothetical protein
LWASLRHGTQDRQNDGGRKEEQSKRKAPAGPIRQAPLGDARGRQGRRQRYGREPAALKGAATKAGKAKRDSEAALWASE